MDSFAYCIISPTVLFREHLHRSSILSFHVDEDAMEDARSMVQLLHLPNWVRTHAGKKLLIPGHKGSKTFINF